MVLAVALSTVGTGVTFAAPAAPAARLIPALGEVAGVRMEVAPALAREVLVVSVRDVPLADLVARIAKAVGGEWTQKDGVERLGLSASAAAKDRRAEAAERETAWRGAIDQRLRRHEDNGAHDLGSEAVARVLANLPAGTFGDLGFQTRIVFSTRPTALQRPLSEAALNGVDLTGLQPVDGPRLAHFRAPAPGQASQAWLVLQTQGEASFLQATLTTADERGRTVGSGSQTLGVSAFRPLPLKEETGLPAPKAILRPSAGERAGAFPHYEANEGRSDGTVSVSVGGGMGTTYSDAELAAPPLVRKLPELLQPEKTEPLALTAGPLLSRLAEAEEENLVVDVPDGAFYPARVLLTMPNVPAGRAFHVVQSSLGVDLTVDGGWLVERPHRPVTARAARLDRTALGVALRSLVKDGAPSLEAQAAYAAAQPLVAPSETFEGTLFGAVEPGYGRRIAATCTSGERQVLRLYGAVKPFQGDETRTFGSLPDKARKSLERLVYDSFDGPNRIFPYGPAGEGGTMTVSAVGNEKPWSLDMERTAFWPSGIPSGASLRETVEATPAIFGLAASGARPLMHPNLAAYRVSVDSRQGTTVATALPRLDRYARGAVRRVSFTLTVPFEGNFSRALKEERIDPKAPTLAYGELSGELRERIEATERQARTALDNIHSQPGSNKP